MRNQSYFNVLLTALVLSFSSCSIIGGIFKTGVGVGIFLVVLLIIIVLYLVNKFKKR